MDAIAVQIKDDAVMRDRVEIGYKSRDYNRQQAKTHRCASSVSLSGEAHREWASRARSESHKISSQSLGWMKRGEKTKHIASITRFERPYMVRRRLLQLYATRYRAGRKRRTS